MTWFADATAWSSGDITLSLRDDEFADIAYRGRVVLRSVRAVVRDRNWDTAPLIVDAVAAGDAELIVHVHSDGLGSSFRGTVRVAVGTVGVATRVEVSCDLRSTDPFDTNRTGLVVLHPPHVADAALEVSHSDGSVESLAFPDAISPHQPARDIVGLAWHDAGVDVDVRFDGDVFEMEDQRNWTDASYKTYSRPLSLPFPYDVAAGEHVRQTVTLDVSGTPTVADGDDGAITLVRGGAFPSVGVAAASAPDPAPDFPALGAFTLVELDLASTNWRAALDRAGAAGVPLDVRFIIDPTGTATLADGVAALAGRPVVRATAFHQVSDARHVSDVEAISTLRDALAAAELPITVIGGSRSHFTELNREHFRLPGDLDGLAVTVTPLFHALGTEQLVESVAMQRLVARQTTEFADGVPVHVGPITLRPRFNDVATGPQPTPEHADLRDGYGAQFTGADDVRQDAPELAAWVVASAAALALPGVATLSWFEEWGPRGLHDTDGTPRPVAAAVAAVAALAGTTLWHGSSPDGLVWAIGGEQADTATVLVANLDRSPRAITVTTPFGTVHTTAAPGAHSAHILERDA